MGESAEANRDGYNEINILTWVLKSGIILLSPRCRREVRRGQLMIVLEFKGGEK